MHFYQLNQIKRVRVVRRHDGYYVQFLIDQKREEDKELTGRQIGLDVGLNHFYTDSLGEKVDNPRFLKILKSALKQWATTVGRTEREVSGEIPLCLTLETDLSQGTQRKRKPKK